MSRHNLGVCSTAVYSFTNLYVRDDKVYVWPRKLSNLMNRFKENNSRMPSLPGCGDILVKCFKKKCSQKSYRGHSC